MPAVPYPGSTSYPPTVLAPLVGPSLPTSMQTLSEQTDPVTDPAEIGSPAAVSGPAASCAPSGEMGTLGWGLHTARFTPSSGPRKNGAQRTLQDPRQLHYDDPGTIPGPGGKYLVATGPPKTIAAPPDTPAITLADVAAGLKPSQQRGLVAPEAE